MNKTELILQELNKTKKYKTLPRDILLPIIERYEPKNDDKRTGDFKESLKLIKKELHKVYAVYVEDRQKIKKMILSGAKEEEILKMHSSTKERVLYYPEFYKKIFEFTGKPNKIADLGCGLNPLSYKYLGTKPYYHAMDIDLFFVDVINEYFSKTKIQGKVEVNSALDLKYDFKDYDIVFMLKLLPVLEKQSRGITEKLLSRIKSKHIVVSLPTKSLSSKRSLDTSWITKKLSYKKLIKFPNEDVFIIAP